MCYSGHHVIMFHFMIHTSPLHDDCFYLFDNLKIKYENEWCIICFKVRLFINTPIFFMHRIPSHIDKQWTLEREGHNRWLGHSNSNMAQFGGELVIGEEDDVPWVCHPYLAPYVFSRGGAEENEIITN